MWQLYASIAASCTSLIVGCAASGVDWFRIQVTINSYEEVMKFYWTYWTDYDENRQPIEITYSRANAINTESAFTSILVILLIGLVVNVLFITLSILNLKWKRIKDSKFTKILALGIGILDFCFLFTSWCLYFSLFKAMAKDYLCVLVISPFAYPSFSSTPCDSAFGSSEATLIFMPISLAWFAGPGFWLVFVAWLLILLAVGFSFSSLKICVPNRYSPAATLPPSSPSSDYFPEDDPPNSNTYYSQEDYSHPSTARTHYSAGDDIPPTFQPYPSNFQQPSTFQHYPPSFQQYPPTFQQYSPTFPHEGYENEDKPRVYSFPPTMIEDGYEYEDAPLVDNLQ